VRNLDRCFRPGIRPLASAALPLLGLLVLATPAATAMGAAQPPVRAGSATTLHRAQQADPRPVLRITREMAVENAVKVVPGTVTSVDLERKLGRVVWVVEVQTPAGEETDVLIDVETGEVLGTE
jgi:hypothetical protein